MRLSSRLSMLRLVLPAAVVALAVAAPSGAVAFDAGSGEIGIDLGGTQFDDNVEDDIGPRGSVRLGYHVTRTLQLEGQLVSTSIDVDGDDVELTAAFANVVFNFHAAETIVPYLLAGGGYANVEADFGDFTVEDDSFASQLGVGSRFFFGRGFAARIEAAALRERTFDESSTHLSLTAGLTWLLP